MKKILKSLLITVMILTMLLPINVFAAGSTDARFKYVHDPRINSKAMADIVVDTSAVYGFAPSKDSTRLAGYADADWSDAALVETWKQERIEYLEQFANMYDLWEKMLAQGKSVEEIARAVSAKRNEIRLASCKGDAEGLAKVKKSNLDTYGNENGPTPESLFEKYGSWELVLIKSFNSNSGMDACLGLYDVQYEHNRLAQAIAEDQIVIYTVKKGDYLAKIAMKYFGTQAKWRTIMEANSDKIKDKDLIYEGQTLVIPLD